MLAYDYPLLGVFWTVTIFFLWLAWLIAAVCAFIDNFNRQDHSRWAKAVWAIVLIVLPLLGVFLYLLTRPTTLAGVDPPHRSRTSELDGA